MFYLWKRPHIYTMFRHITWVRIQPTKIYHKANVSKLSCTIFSDHNNAGHQGERLIISDAKLTGHLRGIHPLRRGCRVGLAVIITPASLCWRLSVTGTSRSPHGQPGGRYHARGIIRIRTPTDGRWLNSRPPSLTVAQNWASIRLGVDRTVIKGSSVKTGQGSLVRITRGVNLFSRSSLH